MVDEASDMDVFYVLQGVDFWAINTDVQALQKSQAEHRVQIGESLTRGLGESMTPL